MSDAENDFGSADLPAPLCRALLDQVRDLIALTDSSGTIRWANARFIEATGFVSGRVETSLLVFTAPGPSGSATRLAFAGLLGAPEGAANDLEMRGRDGAPLWVDARTSAMDDLILWTLTDASSVHRFAAQDRRQAELLETAQKFGRLGVWERSIPSGEGRWDAHVFGFWGLDPASGTPTYVQAIERIHPEDRTRLTYTESTRRAGRYAQRYRVVHPDGKTRWIHSQWEVKTGRHGTPDRALGVMMDDTEAYDAARALGDVNAQLKMAVELGKISIWRHDLRTDRMFCTDRGFELLGMPPRPEGHLLAEVRSYIHPEDLPAVITSAQAALQTDEPIDVETRYRRADGSWRYVLTRRVVERSGRGEPLAFVGVALDVTERVEHLRHSEELARRMEAASQAAGVGIWTTTVDPPQTDWNAQMFALFDRYTPPDTPSLGRWLAESVHADDRERVEHEARAFLLGGVGPLELEFRTLARDGRVRWMVLRANVDPVLTDRRRLLGVAMDVTEQHQTLDALREAVERASLITHQAGIGTWEAAMDGSPERWDEQMFQLRGWVPSEKIPNREERMASVHPDDLPLLIDSFVGTRAADLPTSYEFRFRMPDGSYRWLASRSAIVYDDSGRPIRRVGVNWDVTEPKNAELARQQAALAEREIQAKSQFLSRMSHELRTPLNAVLGFTQLLQIEAQQTGQTAQLAKLEHIRSAGDHLLSLINDVLDLSALESGEVRLSLRPVDLGELVRGSLPLLQSLAAQHGVTLEIGASGGIARADPTRLRQVLINLLSNAIKYNRRGGRVLVETRATASGAQLTVRDTGRGLSREQVANLFEPFNRFGIESEGIEGTGIGLTIVKALVDGMSGRIEVASQPGDGTVFEVSLPSAETPAAAIGTDASRTPATRLPARATPTRSGSILYIEDNHVNVLLVEELVKSIGGLTIVSEPTGAAGVARARILQPDLVLVDLQLPDFDGYEVLRRLRAEPLTRAVACIALSANAMPEDIERGLAAGFIDYWTKPIDFALFIAALAERFPGEVAPAPASALP